MPVSPSLAENLAAEVVARYAEAERLMIERIARNLAKGIDGPAWAQKKLAQMRAYRRETAALLADLKRKSAKDVRSAIVEAYERGGLSAVADIAKVKPGAAVLEPLAGLRAIEALTAETLGYLNATHTRILRSVMNAYQTVIGEGEQAVLQAALRQETARAAAQVLLGTQTRLQAAQSALNAFAKRGITGFVDAAGHGWNLESYTEMALRTGAGRAAVAGHVDRLLANGFDLVIVSEDGSPCELCAPHEGQVYSLSGNSREYPSLDEAQGDGLFHVNCRHDLNAYQPGVTPKPEPKSAADLARDAERYGDRQKLRDLERQTRASKRLEAAAMDDAARKAAGVRVREYQRKIREHVASTSAKRIPVRERLGAL